MQHNQLNSSTITSEADISLVRHVADTGVQRYGVVEASARLLLNCVERITQLEAQITALKGAAIERIGELLSKNYPARVVEGEMREMASRSPEELHQMLVSMERTFGQQPK
jgi:hypothetical protein